MSSQANNDKKIRRVKQIDDIEHAKKRSMWLGSKSVQSIETYTINDNKFITEILKYPPALLKIIDEIIVNAIDHHTEYPTLVTNIEITLDKNGWITVLNNGPGFFVEKTKNIQNKEMYSPQLIFTEFRSGSNLDDDETPERIVGGQNGLGAKLTVVFSEEFKVETYDYENKILYKQTFKKCLSIIEEPIIVFKYNNKELINTPLAKGYTKISFLPDYSTFKLDINDFYPTLYKIIQARTYQASAYLGINIKFNDKKVPIKTFDDFCSMFNDNDVFSFTMSKAKNKYPWEICIAITDGKERHFSMINGVVIPSGGTHIKYIQKYLVDQLKDKIEKELKKSKVKFNKNILLNNLFIFMKGSIPNPEFLSQTKDAISNPIDNFEGYEMPSNKVNSLWTFVEPVIMANFLKKQIGDMKMRTNRGKIDVPKYREANYCRDAKKCHQCGLIITEGDSATGTANTGLLSGISSYFNYDYFGTFGIQGVMVNGLKECIEYNGKSIKNKSKSSSDNKKNIKYIPNKKVLANERITSLVKVLGLDFNKNYTFDEQGEKEYKTLRYGFIVGLTDQDLDGYNIFGLLSTFFLTYFPNLVRRGFIRQIQTPLVRAYPTNRKNFVKEFYNEKDVKKWIDQVGEDFAKKNYSFKYYKGLGSHVEAKKEVTNMFKEIDKKIADCILDEDAINNMYIYYGEDTAPRKIALSSAVTDEKEDNNTFNGYIHQKVNISNIFNCRVKAFQRDNIIRKLVNAIDGFVVSRRKVFYTARKIGPKEMKVAGLASEVVSKAEYHHGEASLEQTIVRMAQAYPDARNLPLLLPLGNFGSRSAGYKDYAASRYIYTMINHRLADKLFRKEDEFVLDYEIIDGERYEPKYYVPIIPYSLCETNEIPATGWTINIHARDIKHIFKNIYKKIENINHKCEKLPIWKLNFKGEIRKYKNRDYYVGSYVFDEKNNSIRITELPPGNYSNIYLKGSDDVDKKKGIINKEHIADYNDNTTLENVDITLYLKENSADLIQDSYGNDTFDAFEEYLELKEPIYNRLNLINDKGEVVEYGTYEEIFEDWFQVRKQLYEIRIEREIILNDLEIKMLKNIQRFSKEHVKYGITHKTDEDTAIKILEENKYDIFNKTLLESPRFTTVKLLIKLITSKEHGASYDYLMNISYRELTEEAYAKRNKRIKELEDRQKYLLDDTGAFKGAKLWMHELKELEESIEKGMSSDWFYGTNKYLYEKKSK